MDHALELFSSQILQTLVPSPSPSLKRNLRYPAFHLSKKFHWILTYFHSERSTSHCSKCQALLPWNYWYLKIINCSNPFTNTVISLPLISFLTSFLISFTSPEIWKLFVIFLTHFYSFWFSTFLFTILYVRKVDLFFINFRCNPLKCLIFLAWFQLINLKSWFWWHFWSCPLIHKQINYLFLMLFGAYRMNTRFCHRFQN